MTIQKQGTPITALETHLMQGSAGAFRRGYEEAGGPAEARQAEQAQIVRADLFRVRRAAHVTRDAIAQIDDRIVNADPDADGSVLRFWHDRRDEERRSLARYIDEKETFRKRLREDFGEDHSADF